MKSTCPRATSENPKVPTYEGGKFPLSTYLADRVRQIFADHEQWRGLPDQVRSGSSAGMALAAAGAARPLVETFPRANKHYLVCYPFEGRLAHQTLGMLLTRRLERARLRPLGFVANEYALAVWSLGDAALRIERGELSLAALFDEDMLGDDLEAWLAQIRPDETNLPYLRDHRRVDRAPLPRQGEVAARGHDFDRSGL